jgi:hypothetical protein
MKEFINNLKGDKVIWAFIALLALISFMPVYSASSNLAYSANGSGNTMSFFDKAFCTRWNRISDSLYGTQNSVPLFQSYLYDCFANRRIAVALYALARENNRRRKRKPLDSDSICGYQFPDINIGFYGADDLCGKIPG